MNRNRVAKVFLRNRGQGRGEFQTLVMILAGWVLVTAALAAVLGLLHRIAPS